VDPLSRRAFWDLINQLTDQGITVFVSTHYMEEAEYCHRLALMNRARLIALDTPSNLRAGMVQPIIDVQVDHSPRAVEVLSGAPGIMEASMFGRAVHVVVEDEATARAYITDRLAAHGVAVASLTRIEPSLEDVFVALVRAEGGAVEG
jgi:ABC-2 type transport system ATP-binding protein